MKREILNNVQKKILKHFGQTPLAKYFYWTGGTLLAFKYLNHRFSEDLDFFSDDLFPDEFIIAEINKLKKIFKISKILHFKKLNRQIFEFKLDNKLIKIEFVFYPFPALQKRILLKEFGIKIDSLKDIAANKTFVAYERSEPKDIFDLYYFVSKKKFKLKKLIQDVERKFGIKIDLVHLSAKIMEGAEKLNDIKPLLFQKDKNLKKNIKEFFLKEAKNYLKKAVR